MGVETIDVEKSNEKSRIAVLLFSHFQGNKDMEKVDYFLEECPFLIIKYTSSKMTTRTTRIST